MLIRVTGWLWWFTAFSMLLLALLVVLVRQVLPSIADYKGTLETYLSELMDAPVTIDSIEAHWDGAYPSFTLNNLKALSVSTAADVNVSIHHIDAQIDPLASLTHFYPVFRKLSVDQLDVSFKQAGGRWVMSQTDTRQVSANQSSTVARDLIGLLSLQPEISFTNARIKLQPEKSPVMDIKPVSFRLTNSESQHHLFGSLELNMAGESSSAQFAIETGNLPSDPLKANYQLYLNVSNLGDQLLKLDLIDLPWEINTLKAGSELWAEMRGMQLFTLQGRLGLKQLDFAETEQLESISNSHFTFSITPKGKDEYQVHIADFLLQNSEDRIVLGPVSLDLNYLNHQIKPKKATLEELDLSQISNWLKDKPYVSDVANRALHKLDAKGRISNAVITWSDEGGPLDFTGEADLHGVTVGDYYGAPALGNITGRLEFSPQSGSIHLNTADFDMHFPELFKKGWHYKTAIGQVSWKLEDREGHDQPVVTVNSGLINLENNNLKAAGRFSMFLPLDRKYQSELILMIALKDANALVASSYVPPAEVGESLHKWVDAAIKGGDVSDAMLLLRTDTRTSIERTPITAQLFFDVQNAKVKFLPDWPEIENANLQVSIENGAVEIEAQSGQLLNSKAERVRVTLPSDGSLLEVKTRVKGEASDIITLLTETDLRKEVGSELDGWELSGQHQTDVTVKVPMQSSEAPEVNAVSRLNSARFHHPKADLDFSKISGSFNYRSDQGLSAKSVKAQFLNSLYQVDIATESVTTDIATAGSEQIQIYFDGQLSISELQQWLEWDSLAFASGTAPVSGRVGLCGTACTKLVLNSGLQGIGIDLPAPLGKSPDEVLSLQLVANPGMDNSLWRYNLGNQVRGATQLNGDLHKTLIQVGGKRPREPAKEGIHVIGHLPKLDLGEWKNVFSRPESNLSSGSIDLRAVKSNENVEASSLSLSVDQIIYDELEVSDVDILATERDSEFRVGFVSPSLTGAVTSVRSDAGSELLNVQLKHINLDVLFDTDARADLATPEFTSQSLSQAPDLTGWTDIDLSIDKVVWNQNSLGTWTMQLRPDQNGMRVQSIKGELSGFPIQGNAGWKGRGSELTSYLDLESRGDDLGRLLSSLGYSGVLESDFADLSANFNWSGMPWDFTSENLNGDYKMLLKKGRIIESGNSSNILRLFGILNFNTLVRRLQLNFNDLVEKGVTYDRLYSHFTIDKGLMKTSEDLVLQGPSSDLKLRGEVDLPQQSLNADMDVVLPLTGNIPLAAVLMGAPQVAGAAFIIDKLFGDKLQQVTTLRYQLNGPWADLNVVTTKPETLGKDRLPSGDH